MPQSTQSCNLCDERQFTPHYCGVDVQLLRDTVYCYEQCDKCGLIFQNPRLYVSELDEHYPDHYQRYIIDNDRGVQKFSRQHSQLRLYRHIIKHTLLQGCVLDIGCATGDFLSIMREYGWDTVGVEISEFAAQYARQTRGLDVHLGTLAEQEFSDNQFDLITLWDVLEHVINPKETLEEVYRLLKPGGFIALSTPNPLSLDAKIFGKSWSGWDRPRHLHIFSPENIQQYLEETGFQNIYLHSMGGRLGVSLHSLQYWLVSHSVSSEKAARLYQLLYNPFLRLITLPVYLILERLNLTTNMMVIAQAVRCR